MNLMKKLRYTAAILLLITPAVLFSQAWRVVSAETAKTVLTDGSGRTCDVFSDAELSGDSVELIGNCLSAIWALPGLTGTEAKVKSDAAGFLHFIIYPESLSYKNVELRDLLPSGLSFKYDTTLFYDVTMKVGNLAPRVAGTYVSPENFLEQLYAASVMPELYLYDSNLLDRVARLEQTLMAISKKGLFSKPAQVDSDIVLAVRNLYNQNPEISVKEATSLLKQQGIAASAADIQAVFMVYLGKFE